MFIVERVGVTEPCYHVRGLFWSGNVYEAKRYQTKGEAVIAMNVLSYNPDEFRIRAISWVDRKIAIV